MARYTTGPRVWTDPASGIHYVRFEYQRQQIFESTGTRNLGEAQAKANTVFAEVVSGRRTSNGQAVAAAPSREILVLAAAWLAEVEAELSESTRDNYAIYMATHLPPFFKTIDRVTSESAIDYRRMRLKAVQRISLLKELSCLRGFMTWCKSKKYIVEVPVVESPSEKVTGTVDTKKRHKAEPVPLDQTEAYAIIENLPEFAERARPGKPRYRVRDVVTLWWETALRPITIGRLRCPDHFRPGATELTITRDIDKVRYKRRLPLTDRARESLERSCPDIGLIFGVHDLRPQLLKAARRAHEAGKLPAWKIDRVSPYDFRHGRTTQLANRTKHLAGFPFSWVTRIPRRRRGTCTRRASMPKRRFVPSRASGWRTRTRQRKRHFSLRRDPNTRGIPVDPSIRSRRRPELTTRCERGDLNPHGSYPTGT